MASINRFPFNREALIFWAQAEELLVLHSVLTKEGCANTSLIKLVRQVLCFENGTGTTVYERTDLRIGINQTLASFGGCLPDWYW